MRKILVLIFLSSVCAWSQSEDELKAEFEKFQAEQNEHYSNKETSPLKRKERKKFKGHSFYDFDIDYRVTAKVVKFLRPDTIIMPTSAGTEKAYSRWATLHFKIGGAACQLVAYRRAKEGQDGYLFIPFKDHTSGFDTYGGGRYLDLDVPKGDDVILNFNLAYNPYCAYTTGWFCPIPPEENTLDIPIKAGLKAPPTH